MASSYGSASSVNISTGMKAKLQKWMGKASSNVRDKRSANSRETLTETKDYSHPLEINNGALTPQHSRARSAPIPMLHGDKIVVKKTRKGSLANSPTYYKRVNGDRENDRIISYPKNGIPKDLSHSMVLYESSSDPSSSPRKQNNTELSLTNQTHCVSGSRNVRAASRDDISMTSANTKEMKKVRAQTKGNKPARAVSKTSEEYSDESANSDSERLSTNSVFENSPSGGLEQLSEQIQSRLQKWVERASYIAAMRERRASEESASSTDDSLNPPESPNSRSSTSEAKLWKNESQVKKIKELELALKELVGNIGVRVGKQDGTQSPSSGQGSRHDSQRENEDLIRNESQNLLSTLSKDIGKSDLEQNRANSTNSDPDARVNTADEVKLMSDNSGGTNDVLLENPMEDDEDEFIFMKSGKPNREMTNNGDPPPTQTLGRRSADLQEVLLCQTLIEQFPKQNGYDSAAKIAASYSKKLIDDTSPKVKNTVEEGNFSAAANSENHSCKTEAIQGQNRPDTSKCSENKARDTTGNKPVRPNLRKRNTAPDGTTLKVGSALSVRESMRQYLNFKDADLSAFAVECVRHANKKKQNVREEEVEEENIDYKAPQPTRKEANTTESNGSPSSLSSGPKPDVVISSQDENSQTSEAYSTKSLADSRGSSIDEEIVNSEASEEERSSHYPFARTAEEAGWSAKEFALSNEGGEKEILGRSSSNPQQGALTSQRLYKFPSMPMFYFPKGNEDAENGSQKKSVKFNKPPAMQRRSLASFPSAFESLGDGTDPFYHGLDMASKTKPKSSSSLNLHGKDQNANEVNNTKPLASSNVELPHKHKNHIAEKTTKQRVNSSVQLNGISKDTNDNKASLEVSDEDKNHVAVRRTKQRAFSSIQLSSLDKESYDNKRTRANTSSSRPPMRKRKNSAPTGLAVYPMSTSVRVDIEALI